MQAIREVDAVISNAIKVRGALIVEQTKWVDELVERLSPKPIFKVWINPNPIPKQQHKVKLTIKNRFFLTADNNI